MRYYIVNTGKWRHLSWSGASRTVWHAPFNPNGTMCGADTHTARCTGKADRQSKSSSAVNSMDTTICDVETDDNGSTAIDLHGSPTLSSWGWLAEIYHDLGQPSVKKAIFVEFVAQILFNFASCSAVSIALELAGDSPMLFQVAPFHFLLLYVLIGATQPISGGHFNPMVSCTLAYMGVLPLPRLLPYVAAQLAGGSIGSLLQYNSLPDSLQNPAHAGIQAVPADRTVAQAFIGETMGAFILMTVVCLIGLDPKGDPKKIPLCMALTVALLIYTVGPISSLCINPARAFGPALASGFWENHWLWWTAPFVGGFCAVVPYRWMLEREANEGDNLK